MGSEKITQEEILKEYFINNPNRDVEHPEIVDYVVSEYKKRTGLIFRDPDRGIRKLYQCGFLVKVKKGIYKYDPELASKIKQEDFTEAQKKIIKERDGYMW